MLYAGSLEIFHKTIPFLEWAPSLWRIYGLPKPTHELVLSSCCPKSSQCVRQQTMDAFVWFYSLFTSHWVLLKLQRHKSNNNDETKKKYTTHIQSSLLQSQASKEYSESLCNFWHSEPLPFARISCISIAHNMYVVFFFLLLRFENRNHMNKQQESQVQQHLKWRPEFGADWIVDI